ncbi:pantothenate kinase [Leptolyngbya ohadii]|uniref:pantothenate kinase n=1 Tax=Leptolyngbya ohadii TaxID=1962290 RepID=UPI000B59D719|nr:pantothenate kinase [Leptolyngbya ohadii]
MNSSEWLALAIGNSRLHWAWFRKGAIVTAWDSPHSPPEFATLEFACQKANLTPEVDLADLPLYIASVVPAQTELWLNQPRSTLLTLDAIPFQGLYPTLGIDRALALWGAAVRYGLPALAIDGGTALTFSGANAQQEFIGGAILPGLGLQRRSLSDQTAALPFVKSNDAPPRWAKSTAEAIQSGIFYTALAGIREFVQDWRQQFGKGAIVLTGGDAELLMDGLTTQYPELLEALSIDSHLIFWGMQAIVERS